jgi:prepilin-type N-terminal cleavage/methylation domain-containing protein
MQAVRRDQAEAERCWWPGRPDRGGFTLIEIMVVMVVLVIGILPLAMVQTRASEDVRQSDRFTQAITLAQEQLEQMKGEGFGNAVPDSGSVGEVDWQSRVTLVSFGLERLEVEVSWRDRRGDRSLVLADMVSVR